MNCPYCNKEMKKGVIDAKSRPIWTTRNKATVFKRKDEVALCNWGATEYSAAYYCEDCNKYFCGNLSYSLLRGYLGKFLAVIHDHSNENNDPWHIEGESNLHRLGYNVINGQMTLEERQNLLVSLLTNKLITYFEVVATIEQNIRIFDGNYRMRAAVEKWRSDLQFINAYMLEKTK